MTNDDYIVKKARPLLVQLGDIGQKDKTTRIALPNKLRRANDSSEPAALMISGERTVKRNISKQNIHTSQKRRYPLKRTQGQGLEEMNDEAEDVLGTDINKDGDKGGKTRGSKSLLADRASGGDATIEIDDMLDPTSPGSSKKKYTSIVGQPVGDDSGFLPSTGLPPNYPSDYGKLRPGQFAISGTQRAWIAAKNVARKADDIVGSELDAAFGTGPRKTRLNDAKYEFRKKFQTGMRKLERTDDILQYEFRGIRSPYQFAYGSLGLPAPGRSTRRIRGRGGRMTTYYSDDPALDTISGSSLSRGGSKSRNPIKFMRKQKTNDTISTTRKRKFPTKKLHIKKRRTSKKQ